MTTPPLLDLPSSSCIASVNLTMRRVIGVTESPFTLETQAFKWPGERWLMSFAMPPIVNRRIASDWIAFGMSLKGRFGTFLMGDPSARSPQGNALGTPVVSGSGQTGNTLVSSGWLPSENGLLLKGDYIQLNSGSASRLHMVVEDVNSNGSGVANISVEPAIYSSPADASAIVVNDPKGLFRLDSNDFSWSVTPGKVYRVSFDAVGVL